MLTSAGDTGGERVQGRQTPGLDAGFVENHQEHAQSKQHVKQNTGIRWQMGT